MWLVRPSVQRHWTTPFFHTYCVFPPSPYGKVKCSRHSIESSFTDLYPPKSTLSVPRLNFRRTLVRHYRRPLLNSWLHLKLFLPAPPRTRCPWSGPIVVNDRSRTLGKTHKRSLWKSSSTFLGPFNSFQDPYSPTLQLFNYIDVIMGPQIFRTYVSPMCPFVPSYLFISCEKIFFFFWEVFDLFI